VKAFTQQTLVPRDRRRRSQGKAAHDLEAFVTDVHPPMRELERDCPSLWMAGVHDATPALAGDLEVDAAVIGAGYTGLSTALALRAHGLSVAILEQRIAGFGASGRNAGHLTPTIGKDLPTLARVFGRTRGRALVALVETAIAHVERTLATYTIACDYAPVGNVMAAVHPRQHHALDRAARAAETLGLDGELLEPDAMRRRGLPQAFTRGFLLRRGGILDPGRYVRGLRAAALAVGAELYEGTPVERLEDGEPAVVHTPHGRVRARLVILATNAYTPALGWLTNRIVRVHVYLFATAPLSAAERAAVDWREREGIYTAHEMLESYRLTADQRIVGGAKTVRYGYGGAALADDAATYAVLEAAFRERFPELRDVAIERRWGGPIAFALDFLPVVGRTGRHGNILYGAGYAGHGVALASYAGTMLADLVLDRDGPGRALWARRVIPLPPEPLRWLVVKGLTSVFGAIDRRVDRAVQRAGPSR
jgi:gamma-glutamylputrescine oxidase